MQNSKKTKFQKDVHVKQCKPSLFNIIIVFYSIFFKIKQCKTWVYYRLKDTEKEIETQIDTQLVQIC